MFHDTQSVQKGTTRVVNLYEVGLNKAKAVDLPGYGFGGGSLEQDNRFQKLIRRYLSESSRLCCIFWCIDARHRLTDSDRRFFEFAVNLGLQLRLVFTKSDEAEELVLFERIKAISQQFKGFPNIVNPEVLITSAEKNKGINELKLAFKQSILESPCRTVRTKGGKTEYLIEDELSEFEKETYKLLIEEEQRQLMAF